MIRFDKPHTFARWPHRLCLYNALFVEQLRQVNSKVHLTGKQSEETKTALQRLLRSSNKHVSDHERDVLK